MTSHSAGSESTKRRIVVVGAVIIDNGRVFAAQRSDTMSLAGTWEFPGGKIEPGETGPEALKRELQEELEVTVTVGEWVETTAYEYDFGIVELSTYMCTIESGQPQLTEHSDSRWLTPDELFSVEWAPADVPAVEKLCKQMS